MTGRDDTAQAVTSGASATGFEFFQCTATKDEAASDGRRTGLVRGASRYRARDRT